MEPASIDQLSILYQSADFLVVNKHWDIRIDSKMWYEKLTVQGQLKQQFPELADPDTYYGFRFCHQLDFSTSGALCVAFSKAAAAQAYACFRDRLVTKAYLAVVRGHVAVDKVTIDCAIGKNSSDGLTHMMCTDNTQGCQNPKPSQTDLIVLQRGLYSGDPVTKVLLLPITGRTHQLRVHCTSVGHPIVGDFTYSLRTDCQPYRMMLHAYYLHIPIQGQPIEVTAPDPFTPAIDSKWEPRVCVNSLAPIIEGLRARSARSPSLTPSLTPTPTTQPSHGPTQPSRETEEDREKCVGWLHEWAVS